MRIHVSHPDGEAKFWLSPSIELARNIGLSFSKIADDLKDADQRQAEPISSFEEFVTSLRDSGRI